MIPGRKVVHEGKVLQDSDVEGILKAEEIQAAHRLGSRGVRITRTAPCTTQRTAALKAIDAKNAAQLSEIGGVIDEACEQCHTTYWYPNQPVPGEPAEPRRRALQSGTLLRATAYFAAAAADFRSSRLTPAAGHENLKPTDSKPFLAMA